MLCAGLEAQEQDDKERRLQLMKSMIDDIEVQAETAGDPSAFKFSPTPILRYNDPVRKQVDATVWRLGTDGRPKALMSLELFRDGDQSARVVYEHSSMTGEKFLMKSERGVYWKPDAADVTLTAIDSAAIPADNEKMRLSQMKDVIRRFHVVEDLDGNRTELRLLAQHLDRYRDDKAKIIDGVVFAFAHGTNPELAVLLECDGKKWTYGFVRLTSAAVIVELDGAKVFDMPQLYNLFRTSTYSASGHRVELP
ncbi:MAG TPA: hypothetical protein VKU82_15530 [Planctomycetaceae bacterium]|nr:hypothetical protein [Planctomycetaceae bacterium]